MFRTILVPTDGSPGAEGAIARALDLARTYDGSVHALYAVADVPEGTGTDEAGAEARHRSEQRGRNATVRIEDLADDAGVEATREVREGAPHRAILDAVREIDADLVVMGTHGRAGADRVRLGSTTERVIALADVPVMAVRLAEDAAVPEPGYGMYDHILVPIDGSDAAERAADRAIAIAERYGADLHLVYVVDTTTYELEDAPRSVVGLLREGGERAMSAVAAEARDRNLGVDADVLRGVPEAEIRSYAAGIDADLIAMGTRGRAVGSDRLLGSTTARVLRRSDRPVLAVS